jgi:hypothetical protein
MNKKIVAKILEASVSIIEVAIEIINNMNDKDDKED